MSGISPSSRTLAAAALVLAALVALMATTSTAMGATPGELRSERHCNGHSGQADWTRGAANPITLPQFNPARGNLQSVTVERAISDRAFMGAENTNVDSGTRLTFRAQSSVSLTVPGVPGTFDMQRDSGTIVHDVGPYDGTLDYAGSSGRSFTHPLISQSDTVVVSDTSPYVGGGTVGATAVADATNVNTIGNGNGEAKVETTDTVRVCVVYTWYDASVGDCVWNDLDHDGVQDASEPGVGGVTVTLKRTRDGQTISTTTTGTDGCYAFRSLDCEEYTVVFSGVPEGWALSPVNVTTADRDSNGLVSSTNLQACGDDMTMDLGIYDARTPAVAATSTPTPVVLGTTAEPANLTLQKLVIRPRSGVQTFNAGQVVPYRIKVTNTGPATATKVRVCDVIPAKMTFVSGKGVTFKNGKACWTVGSLAVNASKVMTIKLRIDRTVGAGMKVVNCAFAEAANATRKKACRAVRVNTAVAGAHANPAVTG